MYYGPFDARNDFVLDWLYGQPGGKQFAYKASGWPVIGDVIRNYDYERYLGDYMKNRNLSWDDVKYPSLTRGAGQTARMLDTEWRAVQRLYR